jgi:hypothetical protein
MGPVDSRGCCRYCSTLIPARHDTPSVIDVIDAASVRESPPSEWQRRNPLPDAYNPSKTKGGRGAKGSSSLPKRAGQEGASEGGSEVWPAEVRDRKMCPRSTSWSLSPAPASSNQSRPSASCSKAWTSSPRWNHELQLLRCFCRGPFGFSCWELDDWTGGIGGDKKRYNPWPPSDSDCKSGCDTETRRFRCLFLFPPTGQNAFPPRSMSSLRAFCNFKKCFWACVRTW